MSRLATRLAAVLAPALLLLPPAAHAQKLVVDDAVGDAKALNLAAELLDSVEGPLTFPAPAESSTDITRTTIAHGKKRLTLTVRFRDLVLTDEHSIEARIMTPQERFSLMAGIGPGGEAVAELYPNSMGATSGSLVAGKPCRTVRARYDLDADLLAVSMSTACIGAPSWVRAAVVASRFSATPVGDGSVNLAGYADDAFRPALSVRSLTWSRKVRRG